MGSQGEPDAYVWGRRPWANKAARELLNDLSRSIAHDRPDYIDAPGDPGLDDILRFASDTPGQPADLKGNTLKDLLAQGLTYQEAVVWYWFAFCGYSLMDIHYAHEGNDRAGRTIRFKDQSLRNIKRVLLEAARKLDDIDADDLSFTEEVEAEAEATPDHDDD